MSQLPIPSASSSALAASAPARMPDALYKLVSYFLPRLMFLHSQHAAQVHWGDIAIALSDFPQSALDLSSAQFWQEWMQRWRAHGEEYVQLAQQSPSRAGQSRLYKSAAACFHWAEFMYFTDAACKRDLRQRVKRCFHAALDCADSALQNNWQRGELALQVDGQAVRMPYYLIVPENTAMPTSGWPCVMLSNGLDSVTEVEVVALAEPFLQRGLACLLFDGPGQGINLGVQPIPQDFSPVLQCLLAFVRGTGHVPLDGERLAFFGVSFGGYLALQVAFKHGADFRCVVNLSGGPQIAEFAKLPRRLKEDFQYAFMQPDAAQMQDLFDSLRLPLDVPCATELLSVHGARDDIFPLAALQKMAELPRHQIKLYPGEAHVCLNYINQYSVEIADWVAQQLSAP